MNSPSVSVILPTYNRSDVLPRAIESVLHQSYSDFELIVVDSGSDDAREVVDSFDDNRISYFWQESRGVGAARNFGMEKAKADLFAFQDDDDEWQTEKLETQMKCFEQAPPSVGLVYTGIQKVSDTKRSFVPGENTEPTEGDIHQALQEYNFVSPQTSLVRRRCFEAVGGFDETLPALEDWEMWLRISSEFEFRYVSEPMVTAYISSDSLSINYEALSTAREMIVRKHKRTFDDEARARHLFWSGHGFMKTHHLSDGRHNLLEALTTDFRLLYLGSLLLSLFGSNVYVYVYRLLTSSPDLPDSE